MHRAAVASSEFSSTFLSPTAAMENPTLEIPLVYHEPRPFKFSWTTFMRFAGPGLLMSIAYVDPGNLESDLQLGAAAGYSLLWLMLWSIVMGYIVQMQAAKLGVVTGRHLAEHCRDRYAAVPRYLLWIMAEVAIIGSDIQEVIGSAIAISLLSNGSIPLWAGVLTTAVTAFILLFVERWGYRALESLFGGLIGIMVVTFAVMYAKAGVPALEVLEGFALPRLPRAAIPQAVALVGSLIMPHNIYLHSALVQTRRLHASSASTKREALTYFGLESAISLFIAVLINLFVIAVFAAGFYGSGADDIGLATAGLHLGERFGGFVVYIWALGLLAAGQSSTMTGTYTGQFVMAGFLDLQINPWLRVTITRAVAIIPTLAVALAFQGSNQLDALNQWLNLLQSVQLPFALVPVLTFNTDRALMGEFVNSRGLTITTCLISAGVIIINLAAVHTFADQILAGASILWWVLFAAVVVAYFVFVGYLMMEGAQWWSCGGRGKRVEAVALEGQQQEQEQEQQQGSSGGHVRQREVNAPAGETAGGAVEDVRVPLLSAGAGQSDC